MNYATIATIATVAVGVLEIFAALGIAIWQNRISKRYRTDDQIREEEKIEQDRARQNHWTNQPSWQPTIAEVNEALTAVADLESEVRHHGPLAEEAILAADLPRLQRRLENLSERCLPLREQLQAVIAAAAALRSINFPANTVGSLAFAKASNTPAAGSPAHEYLPSEVGARAIQQYQAAIELHKAVTATWNAMHIDREGDL